MLLLARSARSAAISPKKLQTEMHNNFMKNSVTELRPIGVGYKEVERVGMCTLLGVITSVSKR